MKRHFRQQVSIQGRASQLSETRSHVRALLTEDRIEEALKQLQEVEEDQSAEFSTDLVLLTRRFNSVTRDERIGTLTRDDADAEKNKIIQDLLYLTNRIDHRPETPLPVRELSPRTGNAARERYLRILKQDIQNRLDVSIHKARMNDLGIDEDVDLSLDLSVDDTPAATNFPWVYAVPNSTQQFTHIGDAFTTYERRLLLLGGPGSGKTTTLLSITQHLIQEAENNPSAPIPLLVNLSKFQLKTSTTSIFSLRGDKQPANEKRDERMERWLVSVLTEYPGISAEVARAWIKEGRIAALLDGLDEVNDEYRAELVKVLNATYLRDYPDAVVVVCSRINEYLPLQDREETRLQLKGAVTLQPLTKTQISEYLDKAQATGLSKALHNDETLYQMAQTPLMLSMMTLAYGGVAPSDIPSHLSQIERRHHLMEAYVARMLQRKERRKRGIPYDEDKRKDVPTQEYDYNPKHINSYLGWLAVRLSVRMQTAFSLHRLFNFLTREINRDQQSGVWWVTVIARAPIILFGTILAGLAVVPVTMEGSRQLLYIALLAALLYLPVAWGFRSHENQSSVRKVVGYGFIGLLVSVIVVGGLGVLSVALSLALPFGIPPVAMGMIAVCLSIVVLMTVAVLFSKDNGFRFWIIGGSIVVFCAALMLRRSSWGAEYGWYIPAVSLAAFQTLSTIVVFIFEDLNDIEWGMVGIGLSILAGVVGCQILGVWLIGDLNWHESLITSVAVAVLILSNVQKPLLPLSVLAVSFALGGIVGGSAGSFIGPMIYGFLLLLTSVFPSNAGDQKRSLLVRLTSFTEFLVEQFERIGDHYLLSPILLRLVAITRCLPMRFNPFSQYAERALLLKRSAGDIEFMHRLLRDYFALRDLQPLLRATDSNRRLEAIRSLGFQGDAAIDALAEFVRSENPDAREAAAWAFGRIASPEVIPHIEVALQDNDPTVRRTAVLSTKNQTEEVMKRLLSLVVDDSDVLVQGALIEVSLSMPDTYGLSSLRGRLENVTTRMLANIKNRGELRRIIHRLVETHHNRQVRSLAIDIIVSIKDTQGVPSIIAALLDRGFSSRSEAADALGELKDPRAVKPLIKVSSARDKRLRIAALAALKDIGTPEALAALRKK